MVKYIVSFVFMLIAIGTIPSVIIISRGLLSGNVNDFSYFLTKLFIYLLFITLLTFLSIKFFLSAKKGKLDQQRESGSNSSN